MAPQLRILSNVIEVIFLYIFFIFLLPYELTVQVMQICSV